MDELSRWSRVAIALVVALAVATALYPFTAKPVTWDELLDMGLAFRPEPRAWRLNRYAHVYALLPFVRLPAIRMRAPVSSGAVVSA